MARTKTCEISDEFWRLVEPLIPTDPRAEENKAYCANQEAAESANILTACTFPPWSMCFAPESSGTPCPEKNLRASARPWSIASFSNGPKPERFARYGGAVWLNMTRWKESPGSGRLRTGRTLRLPLPKSAQVQARRIGGKKVQSETCSSTSRASLCRSS